MKVASIAECSLGPALSDNQSWKPIFGPLFEWVPKTGFTVWGIHVYMTVPRQCFFYGSFLLLVFVLVILSCLFHATLWSPAGKGLGALVCDVFCVFRHFLIWYSGPGVVPGCTKCWSLPSSLPLWEEFWHDWIIDDWDFKPLLIQYGVA